MIDVSNGKAHVAESCLEETGGLGVDIVLDAGGGHFTKSGVSVIFCVLWINFWEKIEPGSNYLHIY